MAMNIIQLQDNLKNLSDQQLAQAVQMPSQDTPPFLVVSELNRRKKMRDSFQAQQADQNKTTVAQDVVAAAGVPQEGASQMAQSLAPQTDMTNNTGIMSLPQGGEPQRMAGGGVIKLSDGTTEERRAEIIRNRNNLYNSIGGINDAATNLVDRTLFGAPLAAGAAMSTGILDTASGISGMVPGGEDLSMWLYDQAGNAADSTSAYWNEGLFPDDPYYQDKPDSHGAKAEPSAVSPEEAAPGTPVDLAKLAEIAAADKAAQDSVKQGGGGGGSSKPSDYEQAIMDALAGADKKAKQDKWMALAQMGLSLMSSQQPNFFAAVGEAGTNAIPAYQKARDTATDEKLALNKGLYDIAMQRQARNDALAAAAAKQKGSDGFGISTEAGRYIDKVKASVDSAAARLTQLGYQPGMDPADPTFTPERQMELKRALNDYNTLYSKYQTLNAALTSGIAGVDNTAAPDPTAQQDFADQE